MSSYTRTGDSGETVLRGGAQVPKHHPRVAACGDLDELNCCIGACLSSLEDKQDCTGLRSSLSRIQEELFAVGALLAAQNIPIPPPEERLLRDAVSRLEAESAAMSAELKTLGNFILPGGVPAAAWLHVCRAVCRRAERSACLLSSLEKVPEGALAYLNRLSDHLFTAARWLNAKSGRSETPWRGAAKGFTLLEILIVVSVIAILASIAIPKFGSMIRTANEAATRGKLASIRASLTIYYADVEGFYPSDLTPLLQPGSKYLTTMLPVYTAEHGNSNAINYAPAFDGAADAGGWGYINSGTDAGRVWVQCTHTDNKGTAWSTY